MILSRCSRPSPYPRPSGRTRSSGAWPARARRRSTWRGPRGFTRDCELKLLPDTSDGEASYAEELAREAAICAKLNNPAVVRVFDFFEHRGKLVLVLEHVEGNTLSELWAHLSEQRKKLGDQAIFSVGARIAGALSDAHAVRDEEGKPTPILHRNLSPETVLVSVDGDVRP